MNSIRKFFIYLFLFSSASCQQSSDNSDVLFGADILIETNFHLLKNKKVGLVINHTSLLRNGTSLIDSLLSLGINVTTIFSPEHGFRGVGTAGDLVDDSIDPVTGIKIYSLYGIEIKPTPEMLKEIDILIFDIQDIGARFYTYISTLYYALEATAENKIPLFVLDRPNPLGGNKIDGPVLNKNFKSFTGIAEIPVVHGMTVGELANIFADEIKSTGKKINLTVIKMENWKRELNWNDVDTSWIPTSPNIPDFETVLIYPGTCLLEGTNVSEGRGTENPFKIIGAPFINSDELITRMKYLNIKGVELSPVTFISEEIPGKASNPKFENQNCNGIRIKITDNEQFMPVEFGIKLINCLHDLYTEKFKFIDDHFDKLIGNDNVRKLINDGTHPNLIINSWQKDLDQFKEKRKQYLLY